MNAPVEPSSAKPVRFRGFPNGEKLYVAEFGCSVGTFVEKVEGGLQHHVPLRLRGDYRPEELSNYDPQKAYRTDSYGKVLCYGYTRSGERCNKRAVNRFPRCDLHGGRLHPLDKLVKEGEPSQDSALSRYNAFKAGKIGVDDLDDEELAACGFRAKDGRIYKPKNVPRELAQAFMKAIYVRAQEELRSLTVEAVHTVGEIMKNKTVEPDIRLKSALSIIERNLGKTPQALVLSQEKPFEVVFSEIAGGSRAAYRETIDAEVVPGPIDPTSDAKYVGGLEQNQPALESTNKSVLDGIFAGSGDESLRNARAFERNPAILAQVVERKPFEYDLTDKRQDISDATKKRYASRALGVDLTEPNYPYKRVETSLGNGISHIKHVDPMSEKVSVPNKSSENRRKIYTLSDF